MSVKDVIQDWYENQIIDPDSSDYMLCPYCDKRLYKTRFYQHVRTVHNRSFEEMIEECCLHAPLPLCPYPGCNNVLMLNSPSKLGGGLQQFCCRKHATSYTMTAMRNNPELRAKHAQEASQRLKDNNPTRKEENRRKASDRMSANWEKDEYRDKVSNAARKNIIRLLTDDDFLTKKADVASRRMVRMNQDKDFLNNSARGRVIGNTLGKEFKLYILTYEKFIKIGVTSDLSSRLNSLSGYKEIEYISLDSEIAADVEFEVKSTFETYSGNVPSLIGRTEVFPLDLKDRIIEFIRKFIK